MSIQTKTEWLVSVGSGFYGPRPFDNEADALAYYEAEMAVPSYMGAGHQRSGSVVKVTTTSEAIRPAPAAGVALVPGAAAKMMVEAAERAGAYAGPCGGCGEEDPAKACLGCRHFFS